jgi:hypothetical protein
MQGSLSSVYRHMPRSAAKAATKAGNADALTYRGHWFGDPQRIHG